MNLWNKIYSELQAQKGFEPKIYEVQLRIEEVYCKILEKTDNGMKYQPVQNKSSKR